MQVLLSSQLTNININVDDRRQHVDLVRSTSVHVSMYMYVVKLSPVRQTRLVILMQSTPSVDLSLSPSLINARFMPEHFRLQVSTWFCFGLRFGCMHFILPPSSHFERLSSAFRAMHSDHDIAAATAKLKLLAPA